MPPYFKQANKYACSLAVIRSVLAMHGIDVTEEELLERVSIDYGASFKNIWNPTIAKLACEYGIETHMYALWPLFKPNIYQQALREYEASPDSMNLAKYENSEDKDKLEEPLPLAYKDMFKAIQLGCKVEYGGLTENRLRTIINDGYLIQTSIHNEKLYKGGTKTFHSLLIYKIEGDAVTYHDPAREGNMQCKIADLLSAANGTGAFMAYRM